MLQWKGRRRPHRTREWFLRRQRRRRVLAGVATVVAVIIVALVLWALFAKQSDDLVANEGRRRLRDTSTTTTDVTTTSVTISPFLTSDVVLPPLGAALADRRSCTGKAVIAAVGQARFAAAGVTWDEVARAPSLAALGIIADERMLADLTTGMGACRTIAIVAEAHIRGFDIPIAGERVVCVGDATYVQPNSARGVAELYAGTSKDLYVTAMSAGLLNCSQTMIDLVVNAVEAQVGPVSEEDRACAARETNARAERFARAIAALDEERIQIFYEIATACD